MGTVERLGYAHPRAGLLRRGVQRVAATRAGAWTLARALPPLDRTVLHATDGRVSLPGVLAGVPVLELTTTGRRSGRARTTPLIGVPLDGDLALVGTRFAQHGTPAWVHNLEADPSAEVSYRGRTVRVLARPATPQEAARIWPLAAAAYPGYAVYRDRITDREVRLFVLQEAG